MNPQTGSYNSKAKLWIIDYDTTSKSTKATISIYNGGIDTMNIQECNTTAGNAIIKSFSPSIAPAGWGYIQLEFLNGSMPLSPFNSVIFMNVTRSHLKENITYCQINYRVQ
jgi:hypothetical protein